MINKKLVSSVLALALVSATGAVFASDAADAGKAATAKIMKECKKEFGKDKAKIDECVKVKTSASSSSTGATPAAGK